MQHIPQRRTSRLLAKETVNGTGQITPSEGRTKINWIKNRMTRLETQTNNFNFKSYIGDCDDRSELQTRAPPMIFYVLPDVIVLFPYHLLYVGWVITTIRGRQVSGFERMHKCNPEESSWRDDEKERREADLCEGREIRCTASESTIKIQELG